MATASVDPLNQFEFIAGEVPSSARRRRELKWNNSRRMAVSTRRAAQTEWTRLRPIRTVAVVELEFAVLTGDPFPHQRIESEVQTMRKLGMSLRAIGRSLGVDGKTVRKALDARKLVR